MMQFIWMMLVVCAVFATGWYASGIFHRLRQKENEESLGRTKWLLETVTEDLARERGRNRELQEELRLYFVQDAASKADRIEKVVDQIPVPTPGKKWDVPSKPKEKKVGVRPTPPPPPPRIQRVTVHEHHHHHSDGAVATGLLAGAVVHAVLHDSQVQEPEIVDASPCYSEPERVDVQDTGTCVDTSYSAPDTGTCVDTSYSAPSYDTSPSFDSCSSDTSSSSSWSND